MTTRTITVTGQGVASAVPDCAVVHLGAFARAESLNRAVAVANELTEAIRDAAHSLVAPERVGTSGFSVWPAYDQQGQVSGYEARHPLTIRCGSLAEAGKVLSACLGAAPHGVAVDSVSLDVSDAAPYQAAAREAAMADARSKAEHLAELACGQLGEVVAITETGAHAPRMATMGAEAAMKADVTLSPGETSVHQSLTVTWVLVATTA